MTTSKVPKKPKLIDYLNYLIVERERWEAHLRASSITNKSYVREEIARITGEINEVLGRLTHD